MTVGDRVKTIRGFADYTSTAFHKVRSMNLARPATRFFRVAFEKKLGKNFTVLFGL